MKTEKTKKEVLAELEYAVEVYNTQFNDVGDYVDTIDAAIEIEKILTEAGFRECGGEMGGVSRWERGDEDIILSYDVKNGNPHCEIV
ncbi:MAG: hypothetical protein DRP62_05290 [Planctomycetota bacterium]|nr:MAG: hypothetical protein DRP62_05290 [Planctomycetota bacterium]